MGAFPTAPPSVIMHLRRSLWPHNVPYQRHPGLLVRASFASEWGEKNPSSCAISSSGLVSSWEEWWKEDGMLAGNWE